MEDFIMIYKREKSQSKDYISYDQMNIIITMQKMWFKIAIMIRAYIKASIYETRNLKSIAHTLSNLPSEVYDIAIVFYGPEAAEQLKNLLSDFIKTTLEIVEAKKYGDKVLANSKIIKLYKIADKISSFLARLNIYWSEEQWKYLLYQYIKLKIAEIDAVIDEDDEAEKEIFDKIETINFLMANYMGRGIIASQQGRV